jgi:hypothetical protein
MLARFSADTVVVSVAPNVVHVLAWDNLVPVAPDHEELAVPPVKVKLVGFFKPMQAALWACNSLMPNAIIISVMIIFFM